MDFVLLDYTTLRVIWWLLLGVLLSGYAVMSGFDLGVGALLPFVANNDAEHRLVINTVGPVWRAQHVLAASPRCVRWHCLQRAVRG
ncbi:cytochrome D ubiquinol oxidase subunit II [Xanthomonas oryzae pv. oryzae]|nr:cytochrome D ubiquinol oxidase subunit II [Xanthomonas oryzae pv. oryzae]OLI58384.1 cytochrome D ubiquinol oxidase subunit II [Xanthomonas oryzae pv. oryzae]OLK82111.1 cytochrome D ubiquinol oxidase subunit II [Xanthomonas oryzae pv. oryzae]